MIKVLVVAGFGAGHERIPPLNLVDQAIFPSGSERAVDSHGGGVGPLGLQLIQEGVGTHGSTGTDDKIQDGPSDVGQPAAPGLDS